jgi:hypothetical protein
MENMSRALIMAGGILIAVLIVSLLVVARTQWGKYQTRKDEAKSNEQVAEFNKRFEAYNSVITGDKIITLVNLANDMNKKYGEEQGYKNIKIYAKLMNKNGSFPGTYGPNYKIVRHSGKKYSDMNSYIELIRGLGFFNEIKEGEPNYDTYKDFVGQFKKSYFKCDDIVYDNITTRVCEMYFEQVKKKE